MQDLELDHHDVGQNDVQITMMKIIVMMMIMMIMMMMMLVMLMMTIPNLGVENACYLIVSFGKNFIDISTAQCMLQKIGRLGIILPRVHQRHES